MNVRGISATVARSFFALAVAAGWWGIGPGTAKAALIVSLEQISSGSATPGQQTVIQAALKVSGSLASPLTTSAFSTVLTWTTSSTNVLTSNLYTVNVLGSAVIGSGAMSVNAPGFLYYDGSGTPLPDMNVTDLNATYQRYVAVAADENYYPTLSGSFTDITIMTVRFGVSPDIKFATFDFSLNGNGPNYGFVNDQFGTIGFTNGGGTISVVPEPETGSIAVVTFGGLVLVGGLRRWLSRRSSLTRHAAVHPEPPPA